MLWASGRLDDSLCKWKLNHFSYRAPCTADSSCLTCNPLCSRSMTLETDSSTGIPLQMLSAEGECVSQCNSTTLIQLFSEIVQQTLPDCRDTFRDQIVWKNGLKDVLFWDGNFSSHFYLQLQVSFLKVTFFDEFQFKLLSIWAAFFQASSSLLTAGKLCDCLGRVPENYLETLNCKHNAE